MSGDEKTDHPKPQMIEKTERTSPVNARARRSKRDLDDDNSSRHSGNSEARNDDASVRKSHGESIVSSASTTNKDNGKEMPDTFQFKLIHMMSLISAIALNCTLTALVMAMVSPEGWHLEVLSDFIRNQDTVLIFCLMLLIHFLTNLALRKAAAALFGYFYCSPHGYSLAAFGFLNGGILQKLGFADRLSLRSTCRTFLSRISYIWLVHASAVVIACFAVQGIIMESKRFNVGTLSCLEYSAKADGKPEDRGWPNVDVVMGSAEYIFGTSLGHLRSEENVTVTEFVFPPQLVDSCNDGTTIIGSGFTMDISTSCMCAQSILPAHLEVAGMKAADSTEFQAEFNLNKGAPSIINKVTANEYGVNVSSIITRSYLCGGMNATDPPVPVCHTVFRNHNTARIKVQYMTDGTPASIAVKRVDIIKDPNYPPEPVDLEKWFFQAFLNMMGGKSLSTIKLTETIPGAVNPIVWWTTANMQAMGFAYLEAGLETMWAMISRISLQRSYTVKGNTCVKNIASDHVVQVSLPTQEKVNLFVAFIAIEFFIQLIALIAYVPWLRSANPCAPGVRFVEDDVYLSQMIVKSPHASRFLSANATMDTREMWQGFDKKIKIGESKKSQEDPEFGLLVLDKPQLVTNLTWGKLYT
jgi:hypothetical protein